MTQSNAGQPRFSSAQGNPEDLAIQLAPKDVFTKAAYFLGVAVRFPLFLLAPVYMVSTFTLGLLNAVTFGLVTLILSGPWIIMLGSLLGTSWLWIRAPVLRPLLFLPGVFLSLVSYVYVGLCPEMGDKAAKLLKLAMCDQWPLSWLHWKAMQGTLVDAGRAPASPE